MGIFAITDDVLRRLFALNCFELAEDRASLFGLRGCLPINEKEYGALAARQVETVETDYRHPRCAIGVWLPGQALLGLYPGSTVPHITSIPIGVGNEGEGCNQLVPSYVRFERGQHPASPKKSQHPAFRQAMDFPVQRTGDNSSYELTDHWEVDSDMGDNLHCGHSQGSHQAYYSSFGCQVLCGTAKRSKTPGSYDSGGWPAFRDLAYGDGSQKRFTYALFSGRHAQAAAIEPKDTLAKMVRYGSTGDLVVHVQDALSAKGYGTATMKGRFGRGTFLAVRRFQADVHLPPDAVVGPDTAAMLGITDWPKG